MPGRGGCAADVRSRSARVALYRVPRRSNAPARRDGTVAGRAQASCASVSARQWRPAAGGVCRAATGRGAAGRRQPTRAAAVATAERARWPRTTRRGGAATAAAAATDRDVVRCRRLLDQRRQVVATRRFDPDRPAWPVHGAGRVVELPLGDAATCGFSLGSCCTTARPRCARRRAKTGRRCPIRANKSDRCKARFYTAVRPGTRWTC